MPDYTDLGYNNFLQREKASTVLLEQLPDLPTLTLDSLLQEISGTKIRGGIIESRDGSLKIDLENSKLSYNDGVVDLLVLGGVDKEMTLKNTNNEVELDEKP